MRKPLGLSVSEGLHYWFLGIDMRPRWRRRVAVGLTYVVFGLGILLLQDGSWSAFGHPYWATWILAFLVAFTGIFRSGGLVKSFDVPKRKISEAMMVGSLDEWARYRYGAADFEESSAEQQQELLKSYRVGTYLVPWICSREARPSLPDEREATERDRASRRTLVWLGSDGREV